MFATSAQRRVIRALAVAATAAALATSLTSCATATTGWQAGTGPIKIVASTDVWGSVANLIAGDTSTVTALISNTNQDPHSFEASARDQLAVNEADIVIMNGGGYDDFVEKMVAADPTPAIVVNAFMAAGDDASRNEHIWFDVDQSGDVAAVIAGAIEAVDSSASERVWANLDALRTQLANRKATLNNIKAAGTCGNVFATEPLIDYLLEDAGCTNLTPEEYARAIEEERDVPPTVLNEAKQILQGDIYFIAVNASVTSSQISSLIEGARPGIPVYSFSELLPQDPDTFAYEGDYLAMLDGAIAEIEGKQ